MINVKFNNGALRFSCANNKKIYKNKKSWIEQPFTFTIIIIICSIFFSSQSFSQLIAAGSDYSILLCNDGIARSSGRNEGRFGNGSTASQLVFNNIPVQNLKAVYSTSYATYLIGTDGTVRACGTNSRGQLGIGNKDSCKTPVLIGNFSNVKQIQSGNSFTTALKEDGTVWNWGCNAYAALGTGVDPTNNTNPAVCVSEPVQLAGLSDIAAIATGVYHSLALKSDGTVMIWGAFIYGFAGTLTSGAVPECRCINIPTKIPGLNGIIAIAASEFSSLALKNDSTVWRCGHIFGARLLGETGFDVRADMNQNPVQIGGLTKITAISAGKDFGMALKSDGTVWTWGINESGQLGNGSTTKNVVPTQVTGIPRMVTIVAGYKHCLALSEDGSVWGWGNNTSGQLGLGSTMNQLRPSVLKFGSGVGYLTPTDPNTTEITSTSAKFNWKLTGTKDYEVEFTLISNPPSASKSLKLTVGVTGAITMKSLKPGSTYAWRVRGVYGTKVGSYTEKVLFNTAAQ